MTILLQMSDMYTVWTKRCVVKMGPSWIHDQELKNLNNKEFLRITHTVEHNYISPSSTVGIQLHVSALYVGHLQVVI